MTTDITQFRNFLIQRGFKEYSASGRTSTCYDYCYRLCKLIEKEGITLEKLSSEIQKYLEEYGRQGPKWIIGKKSHESYYNAIKQFNKFVLVQRFGGVNG